MTVATVESLTVDDKQMWRTIRKELEDIGISVAAFDANKAFIMNWFQTVIETGAFEEQNPAGDSESMHSEIDSLQLFQCSSSSQTFDIVHQDCQRTILTILEASVSGFAQQKTIMRS